MKTHLIEADLGPQRGQETFHSELVDMGGGEVGDEDVVVIDWVSPEVLDDHTTHRAYVLWGQMC